MGLATIYSRALAGVNAPLVTVEVHISGGLPAMSIVGLPEMAVRESKDRVRAALLNANYEFPARKITVNLAPADLPKDGGRYDLAIALGILAASRQINSELLEGYEFIGELALSGSLRAVRGSLPTAMQCSDAGRKLILPNCNAAEAALAQNSTVFGATNLLSVCGHFAGQPLTTTQNTGIKTKQNSSWLDLADVKGQPQAKRALEIAAAGNHNMLMIGPPGSGKTMLASRMPGILPPMSQSEALESAAIHSIGGDHFEPALLAQRHFRAPHHTASAVALVGGGSIPRPGEISLAHNGVLFLDELPEYQRRVLDVLREPLEKGCIVISRAARQAEFPARFQLIAAMNPCPCGYVGDTKANCKCTQEQIQRYKNRISGPILDRIDLHIHVPRLPADQLNKHKPIDNESSQAIRERVIACRNTQLQRQGTSNAQLNAKHMQQHCTIGEESQKLLSTAIDRLGLSARGYDRIIKIARTIADLEQSKLIHSHHISEAIGYRTIDRRP